MQQVIFEESTMKSLRERFLKKDFLVWGSVFGSSRRILSSTSSSRSSRTYN
jgi:hypothetical protein